MKKIVFVFCLFLFFSCNKDDGLPATYIKIDGTLPRDGDLVKWDEFVYISYSWKISPDILERDGFYVYHQYTIDDNQYMGYKFDKKEINSRKGDSFVHFMPNSIFYNEVPKEKFKYNAVLFQRRNGGSDSFIASTKQVTFYFKKN